MASKRASASGLEGIVVANTQLSDVDGEAGRLVIAGESVEDLAGRVSFEEVCGRLWQAYLPPTSTDEVRERLGRARARAFERIPKWTEALALPNPMEALRAGLALLPESTSPSDTYLDLVASAAVFTAALARRPGLPSAPDPGASHAEDLLRMATPETTPSKAHALESYLVCVSDHGMNASTFTSRVIASTGSDAVSAAVGAVGALKGPLHGGAPGPVLDMLDAIDTPERAVPWLEGELAAGRRIMGMGHRIDRVRDPRAAVLERAIEVLEQSGLRTPRLTLARAVERAANEVLQRRHPERPLKANVEFYTAVLLEAVGIPRSLFSAVFACGRMAGWTAHIAEQRATGKLIRPASTYVGP